MSKSAKCNVNPWASKISLPEGFYFELHPPVLHLMYNGKDFSKLPNRTNASARICNWVARAISITVIRNEVEKCINEVRQKLQTETTKTEKEK